MASDHMIRASDRDRDAVVDTLREAYTAGRLTLEEFEERTSGAYSSRTWGELRTLTGDLPVQPVLGSDLPQAVPPGAPAPRAESPRPGPPRPAHPRGGLGPVVPFVMVWLLLVIATRWPGFIAPPVVFLGLLFLVTSIARRR